MWLDPADSPRAAIHAHFRGYAQPFFGLCAPVDVTATRTWCRAHGQSYFLASWWAVLTAAQPIAPLRRRLRGDRVWEHPRIGVASTVLAPDDAFRFCRLPPAADFPTFAASGATALAAARDTPPRLEEGDDDVLFGTVVPWVAFTSVRHAWRGDPSDSVPRVALGRVVQSQGVETMSVALDVHHSLVDGVHAGRWFQALTAAFSDPTTTFAAPLSPSAAPPPR